METNKTVIYFVRHAESLYNRCLREKGIDPFVFDAPLSAVGKKEANEAAKYLEKERFDLIVSSPLSRAIDTCNIVLSNQLGEQNTKILLHFHLHERLTGEKMAIVTSLNEF